MWKLSRKWGRGSYSRARFQQPLRGILDCAVPRPPRYSDHLSAGDLHVRFGVLALGFVCGRSSAFRVYLSLVTEDAAPLFRSDHNYLSIWGYWNGSAERADDRNEARLQPMDLARAAGAQRDHRCRDACLAGARAGTAAGDRLSRSSPQPGTCSSPSATTGARSAIPMELPRCASTTLS